MRLLKKTLMIALSAAFLPCHQAWAGESRAAPLPGLPGSAVPASKTPGTSLPSGRTTGTPGAPSLTAPRPSGSPMLTIPMAPAAFSHGLMQMQEEMDTHSAVHGTVMNAKEQSGQTGSDAAGASAATTAAPSIPHAIPQNNSVESFFQIPGGRARTSPPVINAAPQTGAASPQLRGPLPQAQSPGAGTTTGSRWARWHLQSQAWKTSQSHSQAAAAASATANTDCDEPNADDSFHLGRALFHVFDNMGVPLPYKKDEALAPSLRAQPMELSVVAKKVPNNPNATEPTSRPSQDESPSAAAKIPMTELEGVELPAPGDARKSSP